MRVMITVKYPTAEFNETVRDGSTGAKFGRIIEELKPEAVYFTDFDGMRGAILFLELPEASDIPRIVEPFFLVFKAELEIKVVMTPEDLMKSEISTIGSKWG